MKLKNLLLTVFLTLTLVPIIIVSLLLYQSGFELSKQSYIHNLEESIKVQVDSISQALEDDMVFDANFVKTKPIRSALEKASADNDPKDLVTSFQSYLYASEDKISVGILLDRNGQPLYSIGEQKTQENIIKQLGNPSELENQKVMAFKTESGFETLGIVTPLKTGNTYIGSLISVYNESYVFKIISNYYEITDTITYIYNEKGALANVQGLTDQNQAVAIETIAKDTDLSEDGLLNTHAKGTAITGYYKNISHSPWYLAGFIDDQRIYAFANQFILFYILIIIGVCILSILLSFYFSRKIVAPINDLVTVMAHYEDNFDNTASIPPEKKSYYEAHFLRKKFLDLMQKILLVQHNFEGVYQLYQSNDMGDTNIDIDVIHQTIRSNKKDFKELMDNVYFEKSDCIVTRFTRCFCDEDQHALMTILEKMRDEHLAVTKETVAYTPHLGERWYHVLVVPMYQNDSLSRLFVQLRDISHFKKQEVKSIEQARRDALTKLYNRNGFIDYAEDILQKETPAVHGLLFIDMNYFKMVNDNFGHSTGDDLLCAIGDKLLEVIQSNGLVSRFGGDEFAVFLPDTTLERVQETKEHLEQALVFPFDTGQLKFEVSASVGYSIWDSKTPTTLEALLAQADEVMYKTKRVLKETP